MNLEQLITPTRDDGGIDHRYTGLAKKIIEKTGHETIKKLQQFYNQSSALESEYGDAALQLVFATFSIELDKWQRLRIKKQLRQCLQELGFKSSKVSKLLAAGEFLAKEKYFEYNEDFYIEATEEEAKKNYDKYWEFLKLLGINALYELSKLNGIGREQAMRHYLDTGKPPSIREIQELQFWHSNNEDEAIRKRQQKRLNTIQRQKLIAKYEQDTCQTVPVVEDLQTPLASADPIQHGIDQVITGLRLLGNLDELSFIPQYLNQLKPHVISFEILHAITASNPSPALRNRR